MEKSGWFPERAFGYRRLREHNVASPNTREFRFKILRLFSSPARSQRKIELDTISVQVHLMTNVLPKETFESDYNERSQATKCL